MLEFLGPVRFVYGPSLLIFLSIFAHVQFKVIYQLFAQLAMLRSPNPLLQTVQPLLRNQLSLMEASFGSPAAYSPSTTHILLTAILIVLLAGRRNT